MHVESIFSIRSRQLWYIDVNASDNKNIDNTA